MSAARRVARLTVTLEDVEPAVLRRLDVPLGLRLDRLHLVLQAALGWTDSHLYSFGAGGTEWGVPDPEPCCGARSAAEATLRDVVEGMGAGTIRHLYDFGDGRDHAIRIERVADPEPGRRYPRLIGLQGKRPARGRRRPAGPRRLPHGPRRPRPRGPRPPAVLGRRRLRPRRSRPRGDPRRAQRPRPQMGTAAAQGEGRPAILSPQPRPLRGCHRRDTLPARNLRDRPRRPGGPADAQRLVLSGRGLRVLKAGCVLANARPLHTAGEMAKQFASAGPAMLIVAEKVRAATRGRPISHVTATHVADFLRAAPRGNLRLVRRCRDRSPPPVEFPHARLPATLASGRRTRGGVARRADAAVSQYTGGTTGVAEGAMLTHANLLVDMEMIEGVEEGRDVAMMALPLYRVLAVTVNLLGFR